MKKVEQFYRVEPVGLCDVLSWRPIDKDGYHIGEIGFVPTLPEVMGLKARDLTAGVVMKVTTQTSFVKRPWPYSR